MTAAQKKRAYKAYVSAWGALHPERQITLEHFEERLKQFEAAVDPWITGEGSKESAIRKFSAALGMKTRVGRSVFAALFKVVDAIHPIS